MIPHFLERRVETFREHCFASFRQDKTQFSKGFETMRSPFLAKMCAAALMLTFCLFSASEQSLAQLCRGKLMGKSACGCNECQQPTPAPAAASCGCDSCQSAPAASCGCGDTACGDANTLLPNGLFLPFCQEADIVNSHTRLQSTFSVDADNQVQSANQDP